MTFTKDQIAWVYGSKWKQRYFTKVGDDYLSARRAVGRHAQAVARVSGGERHRLVDGVLSRRQRDAADRRAVRRLPLGELRHPDEEADRVERRLRTLPRPGQRTRRQSDAREHREPRAAERGGRRQRLRAVPLAGAAARASRSRGSTTTGPSAIVRVSSSRISGSSKSTSSARRRSRISPTARRTRTGCRGTTSCRA